MKTPITECLVFPVLFKRNRNSKLKKGIAIGFQSNVFTILDNNLEKVKNVWSYHELPFEGCLPITL